MGEGFYFMPFAVIFIFMFIFLWFRREQRRKWKRKEQTQEFRERMKDMLTEQAQRSKEVEEEIRTKYEGKILFRIEYFNAHQECFFEQYDYATDEQEASELVRKKIRKRKALFAVLHWKDRSGKKQELRVEREE